VEPFPVLTAPPKTTIGSSRSAPRTFPPFPLLVADGAPFFLPGGEFPSFSSQYRPSLSCPPFESGLGLARHWQAFVSFFLEQSQHGPPFPTTFFFYLLDPRRRLVVGVVEVRPLPLFRCSLTDPFLPPGFFSSRGVIVRCPPGEVFSPLSVDC